MPNKKLSTQYLNSNIPAGRYYDDSGTGLHIYVRKSGSKSWSQKIRYSGRQLELGLGNYPMVSLAEARRISAENKALAAKGINPKAERSKPETIPSFREVMELALPSILDELSNPKRYVFRSFSYWKQLSKVKQSCHVQLCHTMGHALLG